MIHWLSHRSWHIEQYKSEIFRLQRLLRDSDARIHAEEHDIARQQLAFYLRELAAMEEL